MTPLPRWTAGALGLLFAVSVLSASSVVSWRDPAAYVAEAVVHGQAYRLVTHLWVHTSVGHAALNLAGLAAVMWLWPATLRTGFWWVAVAGLSVLACLAFVPGPVWGLSGVLHGLFAFNALAFGFRDSHGRGRFRAVLLAGLLLKLCAETLGWVDNEGIAWLTHWAGAAAGWLLAGAWLAIERAQGLGDPLPGGAPAR